MAKLTIEGLKKIKENAKKATALREGGETVKITVHMGTCGIAAGAREVMDSLLEELAESAGAFSPFRKLRIAPRSLFSAEAGSILVQPLRRRQGD